MGHAFISYVREDSDRVDRLQRILTAADIPVWRDTADLWPGEDWRSRIRAAITNHALVFIACFSTASVQREISGQNEELVLALEQLRLRRPDRAWLVPVRFDEVQIPDLDIGAGRTLNSLQRVDLFGENWDAGTARLVAGILRTLEARGPLPSFLGPQTSIEVDLKRVLRDPAGDIALHDLLTPIAERARSLMSDEATFPATSEVLNGAASDAALYIAGLVERYMTILDDALDALVTSAAWARPEHLKTLSRFVERVAPSSVAQSGMVVMTSLRWFPAIPLLYAGGLAAVHEENFDALRAICLDAKVRDWQDGPLPLIARGHPWRPFQHFDLVPQVLALQAVGEPVTREVAEELRQKRRGNRYTPVSDYLHDTLRSKFRALVPSDDDYSDLFDRTEILLGLIALDCEAQHEGQHVYIDGPALGRFTWRDRYSRSEGTLESKMLRELVAAGENWGPLRGGLFGGSVARANAAFDGFMREAGEARKRRW